MLLRKKPQQQQTKPQDKQPDAASSANKRPTPVRSIRAQVAPHTKALANGQPRPKKRR